MTAKSFGYGSVSKLSTIAKKRPSDECHFVGSGIALDFVKRNVDDLTSVTECSVEGGLGFIEYLRNADAVVSVCAAKANRMGWRPLVPPNVCGFDNFRLNSRSTRAYVDLIEKWIVEHARRKSDCRRALVCGGPYARPKTIPVSGATVEFRVLPRRGILKAAANAPRYLCSP